MNLNALTPHTTVPERSLTMQRTLTRLLAAAVVVLAGCGRELDITNPNAPTEGGALTNPRDAVSRLVAGVLATYRGNRGGQINGLGSYGRETYNMTPQDGRSVTGPFRDWRQNNAFTSGQEWGRYGNYRNAYEAMKLVNTTTALSAAEKEGALGVLQTSIALDMLHVIEARGTIGAVVDMVDDKNAVLPFVSRDSVYRWITAKLDEAKAHLDAGGTAFSFPVHSGFSAFGVTANTPAGFGQVNRAIKARVEAKRGSMGCGAPCYTAALTALSGTWIADLTAGNRDAGVYVIYSTAVGDVLNTQSFNANSNLYVHPLIDSIAGVATDDRYRRKISRSSACGTAYPNRTLVTVTATNRPCTYQTNVTPIPIVRNEELVLLRAEARWFTGNTAGAITDLVAVRAGSGATNGGTAAVAFAAPTNDTEFVTELLLQRTLSLFQEGHRFPDYVRFGRLAQLGVLAQDVAAGFNVAPFSVLPALECDARARAGNPGGVPLSCPGNPAP
jgi:starch-binding outer membrane protein, SusD/RagB family